MKKFLCFVTTLALCLSAVFFGVTAAAAEGTDAYSTSDWHPHGYIADIYDIPTQMSYDGAKGTVSFEGSLNAGIATTGFTCSAPSSVEDFSIKMSVDQLQDPEQLTWMTFALFDAARVSDGKSIKDVYAPFNVNNYETSPFAGLLIMLEPQGDGLFHVQALTTKHINQATGEYVEGASWAQYDTSKHVATIQLDSENYQDMKITVKAEGETGLVVNINDGAWTDENGERPGKINIDEDLSAVRKYFADGSKDAYFQFVTMYKTGDHRYMKYTVSELNGKKACDGAAPDYLADKSFTDGSIKTIIKADSVGNCGLYAVDVDSVNGTRFDENDGNYENVQARASSLDMELIEYFRVSPRIGQSAIKMGAPFTVEYTLPADYDEYKVYYVNSDDEVVSVPASMASVADGKAVIQVDNSTIEKLVIFAGKTKVQEPEPVGGGACGTIGGSGISGLMLLIGAFVLCGSALAIRRASKKERV